MAYQIYVPGATDGDEHQLARVGLSDIVDEKFPAFSQPIADGTPDGGRGALFSWGSRAGDLIADDWIPARPGAGFPARCYWIGKFKGKIVRSEELRRVEYLDGEMVQLGDGQNWLVPHARTLPRDYAIDDLLGRPIRRVKSKYAGWLEDGGTFFDALVDRRRGGKAEVAVELAWNFVVTTLQLNHRINAEIVSWLGLIDDRAVFRILAAVFEMNALDQIEAAQKKSDHPRYRTFLAWSRGLMPGYLPSPLDFFLLK